TGGIVSGSSPAGRAGADPDGIIAGIAGAVGGGGFASSKVTSSGTCESRGGRTPGAAPIVGRLGGLWDKALALPGLNAPERGGVCPSWPPVDVPAGLWDRLPIGGPLMGAVFRSRI